MGFNTLQILINDKKTLRKGEGWFMARRNNGKFNSLIKGKNVLKILMTQFVLL